MTSTAFRPELPGNPGALDHARAVADAVLYEGYLLYPYRRSSPKNRVRWQFGVLAPRAVVEAAGGRETPATGAADAWRQQTEVLLEAGDDADLRVRLRFLHLTRRTVERPDGVGWTAVDELDVGGTRHLSFDEAQPREFELAATVRELRAGPRATAFTAPGSREVEPLHDGTGAAAGRLVRECRPVTAAVRLELEPAEAPFPLLKLRVLTENTVAGVPAGTPRPEALRSSLVAAHCLIGVRGGEFLSLLDPPAWAAPAAAACRNLQTFPVLAGRRDGGASGAGNGSDVLLSSPIILYDHPQIAPESPGPLFDSGEIDEILSLRTLTLTDEEKAEARATDPQAAAIVDRVDNLPDEVWARLHGAVRSLRPAAPDPDGVLVRGVRVGAGSRVRLRPRRHGTDAQDMFLTGRTATVDRVLHDVDGSRFVAVTLDDDPGGDLLAWYGRHYHFTPDEIEPLT